mgnify:CR=1 FL=1
MDGVESLQQRMEALAELASVDPSALAGDSALAWVKQLVQSRNLLDALIAPLAGRLDDLSEGPSRYARWKGYPSAPALIEGVTGLARADAARLISLRQTMAREVAVPMADAGAGFAPEVPEVPGAPGQPMAEGGDLLDVPAAEPTAQPVPSAREAAPVMELSPLAKAAREGVLGEPKLRIISKTLEDMTVQVEGLEAELVERAHRLRLRELRILCLQKFAELDPEGYADRQEAQRPERELKFYMRPDGMVGFGGVMDVESAGNVLAWFDAEAAAAMQGQREWADNEKRTIVQINVDILVALARHAQGCDRATSRPKTTMVVRVAEEALREGAGLGTCDSLEAPISVQTLRRMAIDAEVIPVVMGGDSLPLDVGRATRYATKAQRIAAGERDRGCAMCHAPLTWCDAHHIEWWSVGGRTSAANTVMLCVGCHHRVHDCGWIIEIHDGHQVTFIPPAKVDPFRRRQLSSSARLAA